MNERRWQEERAIVTGNDELTLRRLSALRAAARELAHELKNQLGVAIGSAELLLGTLTTENQQRYLMQALNALERIDALTTLCQRLLRGRGGERTEVDFEQLVRGLIEEMGPFLERSGRKLRLTTQGEVPPIYGDRDDLLGFVTTVLAGDEGEGGPLTLLSLEIEDDEILPPGRYVGLLIRDLSKATPGLPAAGGRWSLAAEALAFRAGGGDLRKTGDGMLLILPAV